MRPALAAVPLLVLLSACASSPPPRPRPRSVEPRADDTGTWDLSRRVAEADETFRVLAERSGFPSVEDRTRFSAAMRRARDARERLAAAPAPSEALVAEYEGCVADAWQMHQLFRVGEDARSRR